VHLAVQQLGVSGDTELQRTQRAGQKATQARGQHHTHVAIGMYTQLRHGWEQCHEGLGVTATAICCIATSRSSATVQCKGFQDIRISSSSLYMVPDAYDQVSSIHRCNAFQAN
jgi:hypothetical protein